MASFLRQLLSLSVVMTASISALLTHAENRLPDEVMTTLKSVVQMMDDGKLEPAIDMLSELLKMYPDNYTIRYELALAYTWDKQHEKAIKTAQPLIDSPECRAEVYSQIGSNYDELGQWEKALETYDKGLERFPGSGHMWVEKGIVYLRRKDIGKALDCYETGITADPSYAPNYYRAAYLYAQTNMPIWGLVYAEVHQFLSGNQNRNTEMAQLMRNILERSVEFKGDTINVKLSHLNTVSESPSGGITLSFPTAYEMGIMLGLSEGIKEWSLANATKLRGKAVDIYKETRGFDDSMYLLKYQATVKDAGHWDAYNVYVLGNAFHDEAEAWFCNDANIDRYNAFADWFAKNPFGLDESHTVSSRLVK